MTNTTNPPMWSDTNLMTHIETFGYQLAEMGRQQAFASEARNRGDYHLVAMHDARAEMYRKSANELKKDINAQLTLRRIKAPATA